MWAAAPRATNAKTRLVLRTDAVMAGSYMKVRLKADSASGHDAERGDARRAALRHFDRVVTRRDGRERHVRDDPAELAGLILTLGELHRRRQGTPAPVAELRRRRLPGVGWQFEAQPIGSVKARIGSTRIPWAGRRPASQQQRLAEGARRAWNRDAQKFSNRFTASASQLKLDRVLAGRKRICSAQLELEVRRRRHRELSRDGVAATERAQGHLHHSALGLQTLPAQLW